MANAVGREFSDFKQMLENDAWPQVSHRHMSAISASL